MSISSRIIKKLNECKITEARKPKKWDSLFTTMVIDAYKNGDLTFDNIDEWETEFNSGFKPIPSLGTREILDYHVQTGKDPRVESSNEVNKPRSIQMFWATSVGDPRNTCILYGAKKVSGDSEWPTSKDLSSMRKKVGGNKFNYYMNGSSKSFRSYNSLVKFINDKAGKYKEYIDIASEKDLISSAEDKSFYTVDV